MIENKRINDRIPKSTCGHESWSEIKEFQGSNGHTVFYQICLGCKVVRRIE